MAAPRVMFYSHNGVGVGHFRRQAQLAEALLARRPEAAVLLASGSHAAGEFGLPDGVRLVLLPAIRMVDRYETWVPRADGVTIADTIAARSALLQRAVTEFRPDVLVADFLPAGPYGELLPALAALRSHGGRAIAGFRDIIDEPAFVRELWLRTGVYEVLREHYDAILVYGTREVTDFEADYGLTGELSERLRYVGYLGPTHSRQPRTDTTPMLVACTGGGVDGGLLLQTFVDAVHDKAHGRRIVVGGPLLSEAEMSALRARAAGTGITVQRFVADLGRLIAASDLVVTMPGYNTACEVLSSAARAVVVPRSGPSLEQRLRAAQLVRWRRANALEPDGLDSGELGRAIEHVLASPPPAAPPVPLDGFARSIDLIEHMAAGRPVAVAR